MICSGQCKSLMMYWSVVASTSLSLGNLHHGFTEAVSLIEDFRTLSTLDLGNHIQSYFRGDLLGQVSALQTITLFCLELATRFHLAKNV